MYATEVRERTLTLLDHEAVRPSDPRLLDDGFVYGMVIQHEHQHDETMLATIQLSGAPSDAGRGPRPTGGWQRRADRRRLVRHGDERRAVGLRQRAAGPRGRPALVLDRHRTGHQRRLRRVRRRRRLRRRAAVASRRVGVAQRRTSQHSVVLARRRNGAALRRARRPRRGRAGATRVLVRGRRVRPVGGQAPADRGRVGESLAAQHGRGVGVDEFVVHRGPGFEAFPYREYSEVFFGSAYKVLRGGSWATRAPAIRPTFRNWDYPIRRQIFSGFRCARDA